MDQIKNMLDEEIKSEIEELSELEPGSEEKDNAIDGVSKLYKLKLEETQHKNAKLSTFLSVAVPTAVTAIGWVFYACLWRGTLKFEETGSVNSQAGRNLMSGIKPRKLF